VRETRRDLEQMLDLGAVRSWRPPILETVATNGTGTDALWVAINEHREHQNRSGELVRRRRERIEGDLSRVLALEARLRAVSVAGGATYERLVSALVAGEIDPYSAADQLLAPQ